MSLLTVLSLLFCGALGAFIKETLSDNTIQLPQKIGAKISLGILGSLIIGAAVGYFVDHSPITAFLAGYAGMHSLEQLTLGKKIK